jgi:hypothetical protein
LQYAKIQIILALFGNKNFYHLKLGPNEEYRVTVKDVLVNPDPVVRGNDATFQIPAIASMFQYALIIPCVSLIERVSLI